MHTDLYLLTPRRKALYDEHVGTKVEEDVAVGRGKERSRLRDSFHLIVGTVDIP